MIKCPIEYFTDNIILNENKSFWAVYSLTGFDYDFLSSEGKINQLYRTARFICGFMTEATILIVPVEQNIDTHFKHLKLKVRKDDPIREAALQSIAQTEEYLKEKMKAKGSVSDYRTYIIVKLQEQEEADPIMGMKEAFDYFIKSPVNAVNVWMNLDTRDVLKSKVRKVQRLANKWLVEQSQRMSLNKATTEEVQWLFRRMAYRGLNKDVQLFYKSQDRKMWTPAVENVKIGKEDVIRPYKRDIVNLFSGRIRSKNRTLLIENDGITSYQTFLAITNIPDEFDFPGLEWIYMLQRQNTQAEVGINLKVTEHRAGLRILDMKKREIDSQMEHIDEAGSEISDDLWESKEYASLMEQELKSGKYPLIQTSVTICLASDNQEDLENEAIAVKNKYQDLEFVIERPLADQLNLFMQLIPSVGITVKDFVMRLTPVTLASGVIGATHELGDMVGPYIGTTGLEEKNVYLDMGQACLENKSASATFFGNLGVGKSFNANLLLLLVVIYGGYGLVFDPKGERSHWEKELKILEGLITTVSLSSDPSYRGKLDPYNLYRDDMALANELALNVLSELFKISPTSDEYTAILEAIRMMGQDKNVIPSMLSLAKMLENFKKDDELQPKAKSLARKMRLQQEAGMSQLLFGDGTEEAIYLNNRLNILQIENLKLPNPEAKKEDYSSEENLSTVLMMVLSHFAKKFALVKRPVFKVVLFDESWALGKTTEGQKLYDYLARMGRSLFTGCIFNGHSVLDIPTEGIKNTISYKFCFQTTNDEEAKRMVDYLGLEDTRENRDILKNLGNGECLFRDLKGHVGKLKFDAVFQDIIDVFSTTPTTEDQEIIAKDMDIAISQAPEPPFKDDRMVSSESEDEEYIDIYEMETF